jgi:excisionase family DNA binding protein
MKAHMSTNEIMTVKQIANYLQMDEHTIYRLARKGKIPAFKLEGQWRFKKDLVDKWIERKSLEKTEKLLKEASS